MHSNAQEAKLEKTGLPRAGKAASDELLDRCDQGIHTGLVAWHTLPILAYYYGRQHSSAKTGAMLDDLLAILHAPHVGHGAATAWRTAGLADFEDALQVVCAKGGLGRRD